MNVEFINPFLQSASNILTTMATLETQRGSATVHCEDLPHADITGIIEMVSDEATGVVAVSFPKPVILEIAKRMLDEEYLEIDETVSNLVGEITNMVYGGAKALLDEQGYNFDLAIPRVIQSRDIELDFPKGCAVIQVPLSTEAGVFFVEISFEGTEALCEIQ